MIKTSIVEIANMINNAVYEGNDLKIEGVSSDTRKITSNCLFIPLVGNRVNGHDFVEQAIANGAAASLWQKDQPNIPKNIPLIIVDDVLLALQNMAKSYRKQLNAKFIGVTGSNGKTSTKDILATILSTAYKTQKTEGNFNSEIGVPLTLLQLDSDVEVAVIEMGMWAKKEISFLSEMVKPDIAIITSIGSAHLVDLGSIEGIVEAKLEIIDGLSEKGTLIFNGDNALLENKAKNTEVNKISFGINMTNDYHLDFFEQDQSKIKFKMNNSDIIYCLPILGKHQAINSLAAIITARLLNIDENKIIEGLNNVVLSSWRNEIKKIGDVIIINDSYKSNPESVEAALQTLYQFDKPLRKLVVLGDMLDLGNDTINLHYQLGVNIDGTIVDSIYGFGSLTINTIEAAKIKFQDKAVYFENENKLIEAIINYTNEPCIILFKASRGLQFDKLVEKIAERIDVNETTVIN